MYKRADRDQAVAYIHHDAEAFGDNFELWLGQLDQLHDRIRIVERDGGVAAGLTYFDDGQWFGGRRLGMWAIGGLITAPPFRGRGVGKELVLGMLREARDAGVALSVLYASTPTFYRKCGYEPAGTVCGWSCPSHHLPRFDTDATITTFAPDDPDVRACYTEYARRHSGMIDRDEWHWRFKINPLQGKRFLYRFDFDGQIEGYVALNADRSGGLGVEDYAATSLRARRAILTFLHGHRSVNAKVNWFGGPQDAIRKMIPENAARPTPRSEEWMLRITDVRAALSQRGYPGLRADLHLDVTDEAMPENSGAYVLTIRDGEPAVERGGHATLRITIQGLAALFTGFMIAEQLADAGMVEGDPADLAAATLTFSGPSPFMVDKF